MNRPVWSTRLAIAFLGCIAVPAWASVVTRGYLPLADGTLLNYTLTLPAAEGSYPTVLQYDPYSAGTTSTPYWNGIGYAMIGVNFRGTGCSQGSFQVTRADQWGPDGAETVAWIASQPWSDGKVGMIGGSFTGTSQLATAAFAGPALKAISPINVFPDIYRDLTYPGGVFNQWLPAWILAGRAFVGNATLDETASEPDCAGGVLQQAAPNSAQTTDLAAHPHLDEYWARQPASYLDRVQVPVLGCVTWQDTTVYSRSANMLRQQLNRKTTWMVANNGAHADCAISRALEQRFFDRYLKGQQNGWESSPKVLLVHELENPSTGPWTRDAEAGAWRTSYAEWADFEAAITPVRLYLQAGGGLAQRPPTEAGSASYRYPLPSANTPADWAGQSTWNRPVAPGGALSYTTPALAADAEFAGSGSADLWIASTASDADVQLTLSEVRPDGQELFVQNGWLRLSHRKLDAARSTALLPERSHRAEDSAPLLPGEPVAARIELQPFNHVFRAGSALRLTIDAPGSWMTPTAAAATHTLHLGADKASALVLGWVRGGRAGTSLPACGSLLNQPCRANATQVPPGSLTIGDGAPVMPPATGTVPDQGRYGGAPGLALLGGLLLASALRRRPWRRTPR